MQPTLPSRAGQWRTPAQNSEELDQIERESEYERGHRVGVDMFDVDSSDRQTTYIEVEETAQRHPANRPRG